MLWLRWRGRWGSAAEGGLRRDARKARRRYIVRCTWPTDGLGHPLGVTIEEEVADDLKKAVSSNLGVTVRPSGLSHLPRR